jgi:hypothetical protein
LPHGRQRPQQSSLSDRAQTGSEEVQTLHLRWREAAEAANAPKQPRISDREFRLLCDAATKAEEALLAAPVTTLGDLACKVAVLRSNIGMSSLDAGLAHDAVLAVCVGVEALIGQQVGRGPLNTAPSLDNFQGIDSNALAHLFDIYEAVNAQWLAVSCQPVCARGGNGRGSAHELTEWEAGRAGQVRDRIAEELRKRVPQNSSERDTILSLRIKDEILCEGRILDRELLLEAVKAWG